MNFNTSFSKSRNRSRRFRTFGLAILSLLSLLLASSGAGYSISASCSSPKMPQFRASGLFQIPVSITPPFFFCFVCQLRTIAAWDAPCPSTFLNSARIIVYATLTIFFGKGNSVAYQAIHALYPFWFPFRQINFFLLVVLQVI